MDTPQDKPQITISKSGPTGNAFSVIGLAVAAMQRADVDPAVILQYKRDALSGTYEHLLEVTRALVDVTEVE